MEKNFMESQLYEMRYGVQERRSNTRFFAWIFLFFLFFGGLRMYWTDNFGGVQIDGASMNNTLFDGEQLLMKYSDDGKDAKRGDVILLAGKGHEDYQLIGGKKIPFSERAILTEAALEIGELV